MMKKLLVLAIVISVLLSVLQLNMASGCEEQVPGSITVHKFHDLNSNGAQDCCEEGIEGWVFRLYNLDCGIQLVAEGNTDSNGTLTFTDLTPGCYKVWEELPEGWEPTTPGTAWNDGYYQIVDLSAGQQAAVKFGNVDDCTCPPEACIDLEKTGPEAAEPGETITYHFWVKNCGDVVLHGGAQVYDPLFGNDPIWDGDLDPGEVVEFDKTYTLPECLCSDSVNGIQTDVDLELAQIAVLDEAYTQLQYRSGEFVNTAWAVGHPPGYPEVRDDDSWTVQIICEPQPSPSIDIEKYVSTDEQDWHDADTPAEALAVPVGSDVYFKFRVVNTGDVELTNITLSDSVYDVSGCTLIDPLAPGASFECIIGPFEAAEGLHVNIGTATGDYGRQPYSDTDYAKYNGHIPEQASYTFEKHIKRGYVWIPADTLDDAVAFNVGDTLEFLYQVRNTGDVPIEWTGLTDDVYGDLTSECGGFPRTILPGHRDYCIIMRTAEDFPDGKLNIGTVSVTGLPDQTDPAWYVTPPPQPDYTFEKYIGKYVQNAVQWYEADALGDAMEVNTGESLYFRYTMVNTGNVPIEWTGLTDDVLGDIGRALPITIAPGESNSIETNDWAGDFPEGKRNIATASVTGLPDQDDPAWYITPGQPSYTFEKYINGERADTLEEALQVVAGDPLIFRYEVTNTGDVPIVWDGLQDSVLGELTWDCILPTTISVGMSSACSVYSTAGDFPEGKQNIGTVSVTDLNGHSLGDQSDPAWYITPGQTTTLVSTASLAEAVFNSGTEGADPTAPAGVATTSLDVTAVASLGTMAAIGVVFITSVAIRRKRSLPWWRSS